MSDLELFNATDLAKATNFSRSYIYAAKRAGFKFTHGMRTTKASLFQWVEDHPRFRMHDFASEKLAKENRSKLKKKRSKIAA